MSRFKGYDATGIGYYTVSNFTFSTGEKLDIKVAIISIPTCYGGRINSTLNFSSGALSGYKVIVVAMLGNGESSSPSNCKNFPKAIHYQDCIDSQTLLLTEHLHITTLEAVIGFSMGGQQAYYWAVMHSTPSSLASKINLKSVICICTSARTSGHNYAFLEGPIAALETSFDYAHGQYRANGVHPSQGLRAFGRAYAAWLTCPEWFRQELWRNMGAESLKAWLHPPPGDMAFESWDAQDLLVLARMWQAGDVGACLGPGAGAKRAHEVALGRVRCRVLLMPSRTDQYFPPEDSAVEVKFLQRGTLEVIETVWGHIAGGGASPVDTDFMDAKIEAFLAEDESGSKL